MWLIHQSVGFNAMAAATVINIDFHQTSIDDGLLLNLTVAACFLAIPLTSGFDEWKGTTREYTDTEVYIITLAHCFTFVVCGDVIFEHSLCLQLLFKTDYPIKLYSLSLLAHLRPTPTSTHDSKWGLSQSDRELKCDKAHVFSWMWNMWAVAEMRCKRESFTTLYSKGFVITNWQCILHSQRKSKRRRKNSMS